MTPELDAALRRIARVPHLLVALDFDGTVAPFTDDPADSRSLADAHLAVIRLWDTPDTDVAYVSGRALDSLRQVSDAPPGMLLVGSHGAQMQLGDGEDPQPLSAWGISDVAAVGELLEQVAAEAPGAWVEHKPVGAVLHTRTVHRSAAERLQLLARERVAERVPAARMIPGHDVLEFSLRRTDKGRAVRTLRERTGADTVFYAGDDRTDEDVFRVLEPHDVGVHVGPGESLAAYRVAGPRALAGVLLTLSGLRRRHAMLRD